MRPAANTANTANTANEPPVEALVLSGGAAFAAYEAGVARALLLGESPANGFRPVDPRILTGTSAGAFNAALLAAEDGMDPLAAVELLERAWLQEVADDTLRCGEGGVFRWRGTPLNFFGAECLAQDPAQFFADRAQDAAFFANDFLRRATAFARSQSPIEQRFLELVDFSTFISTMPFAGTLRRILRLEDIRRSSRRLSIVVTNFDNGELTLFSNQDMTDDKGDLVIMASSAVPGIFPPVSIPPWTFVDGGVLMNTPLRPAIHAGATVLHAVYVDPDVRYIPLSDLQTTLGSLQRTLVIAMAANFNADVEVARRVNEGLEALEGGGAGLGARSTIEAARLAAHQDGRPQPYRPLTIHLYHPPDLLGGALGFLDFRRATLEGLIARGYRDAIEHDCAAAGCVLPPEEAAQRSSTDRPRAGRGGDSNDPQQPIRDQRARPYR